MSSNSLPVWVPGKFSSSSTYTMDTFVREIDLILSTFEFCATFSSTFLVTSCSICSAVAPGQTVIATAVLTGVSGSLRWGMLR